MKSIGQILFNERKRRKLTYEETQKAIKIHPKFIKALEEDNYSVFEGKLHAKGFLKIYAQFLDLNVAEVMALWRREYEMVFDSQYPKEKKVFNPLKTTRLVLTPTLILVTVVIMLIMGFFGYLYYQYSTYQGDPKLEIASPTNNQITDNSILDVTGQADADCVIYINNQKVILRGDGSFATSVKLQEGINTLSILAVNKLAKKTEEVLTVIYRPKELPIRESSESTQSTSSENIKTGGSQV